MRSMKRALALLLALALCLPFAASAEVEGHGLNMELTLHMEPTAFPDGDAKLLKGWADMLDMLRVNADLRWRDDLLSQDTAFDSTVSLALNGKENIADLHIWGIPSHILVGSNLLGEEAVMLNMLGWLEFSLKAYHQLNMPLHHIAPYVSTYAHTSAFEALDKVWSPVMNASEGSRAIPRADVIAMLAELGETAAEDRAFTCWLQALLMEYGYDEMVQESLYTLGEWAEGFLAEDGILVTVEDGAERWVTGGTELFRSGAAGWTLTLPRLPDGYAIQLSLQQSEDSRRLRATIGMDTKRDMLDLSIQLTGLPTADAKAGQALLTIDRKGDLMEEAHLRVVCDWERTDNEGWNIRAALLQPESGAEQLVLTGRFAPYLPAETPSFGQSELIAGGVNIFSVYEETLSAFVSSIAKPFIKGMLPILKALPMSTYQSVFALLEEYSLLELIVSGLE